MGDDLELWCEGWLRLLAAVPTADGDVALASSDNEGQVWLWSLRTGARVAGPVEVGGPLFAMAAVDLGAGRHALATCGGRSLAVWDIGSVGGQPIARRELDWAMDLAVTPSTGDGPDLLVTTEKDLVQVIDPRDAATVESIRWPATAAGGVGHRVYKPFGLRFGDGTAGFAVSERGELKAWRLKRKRFASGKVKLAQHEFANTKLFNGSMTYVPDGRLVATGYQTIETWDLDSGRVLAQGELDRRFGDLATVSVAGRPLVAVVVSEGNDDESGVLLWDPATGRPVSDVFGRRTQQRTVNAEGYVVFGGMVVATAIALVDPHGVTRIASVAGGHTESGDGVVHVSAPVEVLLRS